MHRGAPISTVDQGAWGRAARRLVRLLLTAALAMLALAGPSGVYAQDQAKVKRAKELFDAALALMDAGSAAQACPLLEQSQKLDPGMGTQYYLGRCYEKIGRIGSAYTVFDDVATQAKKTGMQDRAAVASEAAAAIAPRVCRLRIVVPPNVAELAGLRIDRDGTKVHPAFWGRDVPVDLGEHTITARADRKGTWERKVLITQEGVTAKMTVPMLGTRAAEGAAVLETVSGPGTTSSAGDPKTGASEPGDGSSGAAWPGKEGTDEGDSGGGWPLQRGFAIGVGALAVAGVVVGAVFAAQASSKWDEALSHCTNEDVSLCDTEAASLSDDATTAANISTTAFVLGGAAAAAVVVLVATDPAFYADEPASSTAGVRLVPAAPGATMGLSLAGRF